MQKLQALFFDFDGVIAESVNVKTEAFYQLFLPYGKDIAQRVKDYHLAHGGVSRFEKFRYYQREFLNLPSNEEQVQGWGKQFSDLVLNGVIEAKYVNGVIEFLEKYATEIPSWVITGTPENEAKVVTEARNLSKYFKRICGSPTKKTEWVEQLMQEHGFDPERVLFLGDATTDYEAAQHGNIHFALREAPENEELFKDYKGMRFKTFAKLEESLQEVGLL